MKTKLIVVVVIIVTALMMVVLNFKSNKDKGSITNIDAPENQQVIANEKERYSKQNLAAESEEVKGIDIDTQKDILESKFDERCIDKIDKAVENIDINNMSKQDQTTIVNVFNSCVYEIEKEVALTEKEFPRTDKNINCFVKTYQIRDYLLELGTNVQHLSELPNNTDSDQVFIAESYLKIRDDIINNGEDAMENRRTNCFKD